MIAKGSCMSSHSSAGGQLWRCLSGCGDLTHPYEVCLQTPNATGWEAGEGMRRTYKMANLRGLTMKMGVNMRPMQVANMARAASRRPPKTSSRSHLLTAALVSKKVCLR